MGSVHLVRLGRELDRLKKNPRPGIVCFPRSDEDITILDAEIVGPKDSPYADGVFRLEIKVPDRYPFQPPHIKFITPVYHPNIDQGGRICLDLLKMPPDGGWKPSIPLDILLVSLQGLLENPNPKDPLMSDIAQLFTYDHEAFKRNAREYTKKHAVQSFNSSTKTSMDKVTTGIKRKLDDPGEGPSNKK